MNATLNTSGGIDQWHYDYNDFASEWEAATSDRKLIAASAVVSLSSFVFGAVFNVAAIVVLVRRRLWRQHEGYLYLLAIFIGNIVLAVTDCLDHFLLQLVPSSSRFETASDFTCKMWRFLFCVVFSTGWYTSALLLNVCLRVHLVRHTGCVCWQRLATKYCTVVGSLVVNGFLAVCFVITDCWLLWKSELISYNGQQICITSITSHDWLFVSAGFQWLVPVCFVIPALCVVAVWTHRRHASGLAFVFFGEDDQNDDAKEFARLSTIVGAAIFVFQFPMIVTEFWIYHETTLGTHVIAIVKSIMLVFAIHIVVVPLCFLAGAKQMREELKTLFKCGCCNRKNKADDKNLILPLDSVEKATSDETTLD